VPRIVKRKPASNLAYREYNLEDGARDRNKSGGVLRAGIVVKYAWIDDQRAFYQLSSLCGVLSISVSDFRVWKRGGKSPCELLIDVRMLALIRSIHAQVKGPMVRRA
jgi:hypothetical protein